MKPAPWWMRSRKRLLVTFWIVQGLAVYVISTPLVWLIFGDSDEESSSLALMLGSLGLVAVFILLQALFFRPIYKPRLLAHGRPIFVSLAIAGVLISLLVFAGAFAILFVIDTFANGRELFGDETSAWPILLSVMGGTWLVSTPLLIAFCRRGNPEGLLKRVSSGLFMGSIIEAAAIIPLDVLVRYRQGCVCWTGTYMALTICAVVGLFVAGPAVFLPVLVRQRKRWYQGHCEVCGYDMRGCRGAQCCPECGAGWRQPSDQPSAESQD